MRSEKELQDRLARVEQIRRELAAAVTGETGPYRFILREMDASIDALRWALCHSSGMTGWLNHCQAIIPTDTRDPIADEQRRAAGVTPWAPHSEVTR